MTTLNYNDNVPTNFWDETSFGLAPALPDDLAQYEAGHTTTEWALSDSYSSSMMEDTCDLLQGPLCFDTLMPGQNSLYQPQAWTSLPAYPLQTGSDNGKVYYTPDGIILRTNRSLTIDDLSDSTSLCSPREHGPEIFACPAQGCRKLYKYDLFSTAVAQFPKVYFGRPQANP